MNLIDEVELVNFASWRQATIRLSPGINLLSGRSGVGKTNFLRAIGLGYFNALDSKLDDAIRFGSSSGKVMVRLRNGLSLSRHLPSGWTLYDGQNVLADKVADINEQLSERLGLPSGLDPARLWGNVIFVDQLETIADLKSSDQSRRQRSWAYVLGVDQYTTAHSQMLEVERVFLDEITRLRTEQASLTAKIERGFVVQQEIDETKQQLATAYQRVSEHNRVLSEMTVEHNLLISEIEVVQNNIDQIEPALTKALKDELDYIRLEGRLERQTSALQDRTEQKNKLDESVRLADAISVEENLRISHEAADLQRRVERMTDEYQQLRRRIDSSESGRCELCGSDFSITEAELDAALRRCDEIDSVIRTDVVRLAAINNELRLHQRAGEEAVKAKSMIDELTVEITNLTEWVKQTKQEMEAIGDVDPGALKKQVDSARAELSRLQALRPDRTPVTAKLAAAKAEQTYLEGRLESLLDEKAGVSKLVDELELSYEALDEQRRLLDITKTVRQSIRQAGPEVARRMVESISYEANRLFSTAWEHRDGRLEIDQSYQVTIWFDGEPRSFALASRGQQVTAALAIRLALSQAVGVRLIVIDEATIGAVDEDTRVILPDWLSSLTDYQIIVVDHSGLFDSVADNVIEIDLINGESGVV